MSKTKKIIWVKFMNDGWILHSKNTQILDETSWEREFTVWMHPASSVTQAHFAGIVKTCTQDAKRAQSKTAIQFDGKHGTSSFGLVLVGFAKFEEIEKRKRRKHTHRIAAIWCFIRSRAHAFPEYIVNFGAACTGACCAYLHLSVALACRCRQCICMLASFQFIDFDDARELHSLYTLCLYLECSHVGPCVHCTTAIRCKIHHSIVFHCPSIIYIYVRR